MAYIGARLKRKEDQRFLRGIGRFAGDIRIAGMKHAAILRSPYAHAKILKINVEAARQAEGVVGIVTAVEIGPVGTIPMRTGQVEGLERTQQYPLANDKVRYVGEPIAVLVAENRYLAEDALELIEVEYDPLGAVVDPMEAIKPGAPVLHESVGDNVPGHFVVDVGDFDSALKQADEILEEEFSTQRHAAVPLETRGLIAEFDESRGVISVWGPTKVVHTNRIILSELLGLPESCIHLVEPDVGGGFGARGEFYPEDLAIPFTAKYLKKPVCWIEDRSENLKAMNHSREQRHFVKVALKRNGAILGIEDKLYFNMGAYTRTHGGVPAVSASAMLRGPYRIENYRCHASCVLTNKTPAGTYRSPGRYEAAFVRERIIDLVAHRLGLDPADVRRKNFIQPHEMPYNFGPHKYHDTIYDSGDYPGMFEKVLAKIDYPTIMASSEKAKREGRAVGVGLGYFIETSGLGPWEYARVEVDPRGKIMVYVGCASVGQGVETSLSQIAADALSVNPEDVIIVHGDTNLVPFGMGSNASRTTVMAGSAVFRACEKVKERLFQLATGALEIDLGDLELANGRVTARGAPEHSLSFVELARLAAPTPALRIGIPPGISEFDFFPMTKRAYPYGVHVVQVEVDRETGIVKILRYLLSEDIGRAVNPMLVEGQMVGGLAQGFGGAFLEEFAFSSDGQPLATSFMDYLLPTAMEVPHVETLSVEKCRSPWNPLGVKGAGEGGIVAAGGAIANAVSDALGMEVTCLPMKPEYVRELALRGSQKRGQASKLAAK